MVNACASSFANEFRLNNSVVLTEKVYDVHAVEIGWRVTAKYPFLITSVMGFNPSVNCPTVQSQLSNAALVPNLYRLRDAFLNASLNFINNEPIDALHSDTIEPGTFQSYLGKKVTAIGSPVYNQYSVPFIVAAQTWVDHPPITSTLYEVMLIDNQIKLQIQESAAADLYIPSGSYLFRKVVGQPLNCGYSAMEAISLSVADFTGFSVIEQLS